MKRSGILNRDLSFHLACLGHGQMLVIADAGLPIPPGVACVDLSVTLGLPRFTDVLSALHTDLVIESATIASEAGAEVRGWTADLTPEEIPHGAFKALTTQAACIVRTGEATPYANVILTSGVPF
ncbi:MAG: D-ribose pyranase [Shimia sp.]